MAIMIKVSTFEALTALTWRARTQALEMPAEQKSRLLFAVDGRNKFSPPLPEHFFGNGIVLTTAIATAGELTREPLSFAVKLVQVSPLLFGAFFSFSQIGTIKVNC